MKTRFLQVSCLSALLLFGAANSSAEGALHPALEDSFTFKLGYLRNEVEGDLLLSRPPLVETTVDLEDLDLGNDTDTGWGSFRWRFKERWALNFMYNRYQDEGEKVVTSTFNLDGVEYPVGAGIATELVADAYVMDVSYAFIKKHNYELGAGIGLHAFDLKAEVASGVGIGETVIGPFERVNEDLIAPVPNLRAYGIYAFNDKLMIKIDGGWLSANYGDYEGRFIYASTLAEYRFHDRFGLGVGYQYTDIDLTQNRNRGKDEYNLTFDGFTVYLTASF